jgi:ATP-dependent protease ClpP protease subunit
MPIKSRRAFPSGKPFFRAELQSDGCLELMVYQAIGDDWLDGGVTAKSFKQQIDQAAGYQRILIRINSPGGDAFEGLAIYNLIRAQRKPVEVRIDGVAASAASIIAMAGSQIVMGQGAMMMIHNASGFCMGDASDMQSMADALAKVSGSIAQVYAARTGMPEDEIGALMDAETWMTAQEALDNGFASAIQVADEIEEGAALALARKFKLLGKMKRVPAGLKRPVRNDDDLDNQDECGCDCKNCAAGACGECTNMDCTDPDCVDCPQQVDAGASSNRSAVSIESARAVLEDMEAGPDALPVESAREHIESIEAILSTPEDGVPLDPKYAAFIGVGGRSNTGRW